MDLRVGSVGFSQTFQHPPNSNCITLNATKILDALFYASNLTTHTDLSIPFVLDKISSRYCKFYKILPITVNQHIRNLVYRLIPSNRRLKRRWPRDLLGIDGGDSESDNDSRINCTDNILV